MLTLPQIRIALADRVLEKVSQATGLGVNTIRSVRDHPDANPTYRVLSALSDYIESRDHVGTK